MVLQRVLTIAMKDHRKLTAIMFTDIVGFTAMSAANEQSSLDILTLNTKLHKKLIEQHHGLWLKDIGDGNLAIFDSAIEAAQAALAIQQAVQQQEYQLRVGLHVGDVMMTKHDIMGNGVNIASRIQEAAAPDSITLSNTFLNAIEGHFPNQIRLQGKVALKGIERPMNLYLLLPEQVASNSNVTNIVHEQKKPIQWFFSVSAAIAILAIMMIFVMRQQPDAQDRQSRQQQSVATSIAVLPFKDFTESQDQSYFGDGLAEELLNLLAKIGNLDVASRTSSFAFKHANTDIRQIGKQLNVTHVLEGSVRRSNDMLRVTAQLIKVDDGYHLWSETYDRPLTDIFKIQDEIALAVTNQLSIIFELTDKRKSARTENIEAYDYYLKGLSYLRQFRSSENLSKAINFFSKSLTLSPDFAKAYAGLCQSKVNLYQVANDNPNIISATSDCIKALELDSSLSEVHTAMGYFHQSTGQLEKSIESFNKSLDIDPKSDDALLGVAETYLRHGKFNDAKVAYSNALSINPNSWRATNGLGLVSLRQGDAVSAIELFQKTTKLAPEEHQGFVNLGNAHYLLGNLQQAEKSWLDALNISVDDYLLSNVGTIYFQQGKYQSAINYYQQALALTPNVPTYWGNLADAFYFSNNKSKAHNAYIKAADLAELALTTNPNDIETLTTLALYYARLQKSIPSKKYLEKALSIAPEDIQVLYYGAIILLELNELTPGWQMMARIIEQGYPVELLKSAPELSKYKESKEFIELTSLTESNQREKGKSL